MTRIPEDVAEKLADFVREMAVAKALSPNESPFERYQTARALAALLPEPVDPDLVEARKLAVEHCLSTSNQWMADGVIRGRHDSSSAVKGLLAALKRRRHLERTAIISELEGQGYETAAQMLGRRS